MMTVEKVSFETCLMMDCSDVNLVKESATVPGKITATIENSVLTTTECNHELACNVLNDLIRNVPLSFSRLSEPFNALSANSVSLKDKIQNERFVGGFYFLV